jgi:hypothetical protein
LTNTYDVTSGSRSTYGVSLAVTKPGAGRVVMVTRSGSVPGVVQIQLPVFLTIGVSAVSGGTYNATTHTVTGASGATAITITIAS